MVNVTVTAAVVVFVNAPVILPKSPAGIPVTAAFRMGSLYPARAIGLAGMLGSIQPGYIADCIRLGEDLQLKMIMKQGAIL